MSARQLLAVSAGLRSPSSSRLLTDRLATATLDAFVERGTAAGLRTVELREHARDLTSMMLTGTPTPALDELLAAVTSADGLILVTPIYSGSYTGMVKDLVDLLPERGLAGVPVLMGATGGTGRHALALDHTLRPLLGHVRAATVPTAVFAATEDFGPGPGADELRDRVDRAAGELADLALARAPRAPAGVDLSEITRLLHGV